MDNSNSPEICEVSANPIGGKKVDKTPRQEDVKIPEVKKVTVSAPNAGGEPSEKIKSKKCKKKTSRPSKHGEPDMATKNTSQLAAEPVVEISLANQIGNLSQRLEKCQLEPITIGPGPNAKTISITHEESSSPRVIKLNQTFKFPSEFDVPFEEKHSPTKESFTQTSKTFVTKPSTDYNISVLPTMNEIDPEVYPSPFTHLPEDPESIPFTDEVPDMGFPILPVDDICTLMAPKDLDSFGKMHI